MKSLQELFPAPVGPAVVAVPASRPWFCRICGKEVAPRIVTCPKCETESRALEALARLEAPLSSIPQRHRLTFGELVANHRALAAKADRPRYIASVVDGEALARGARAALELVRNPAGPILGITIIGDTGAGKSTLAGAILDGVIAAARQCQGSPAWHVRRWPVTWVTALAIAHCRAETGLGDRPALLREATHVPLLVLDDLGQDGAARSSEDVVRLVHDRHEANRPTIITTGLCAQGEALSEQSAHDEVCRRYGVAFARRIFDKTKPIFCRSEWSALPALPSLVTLGSAPLFKTTDRKGFRMTPSKVIRVAKSCFGVLQGLQGGRGKSAILAAALASISRPSPIQTVRSAKYRDPDPCRRNTARKVLEHVFSCYPNKAIRTVRRVENTIPARAAQ